MFSIIVPVKNGLSLTMAFYDSVKATNPDVDVEWVIVDSGSTDGTDTFARRIGAQWVSFPGRPFNYCAALNAGAARASGRLWLFANNDIKFRSTHDLVRLERVFEQWPILDVVSPGRRTGAAELEFSLAHLEGCCWAIRADAFRRSGGMPETLSGYGYDEVWTAVQCWRRGRALARLTGWETFHHGSATFGPGGGTIPRELRANAGRLLEVLGRPELDRGGSAERLVADLLRAELAAAPPGLTAHPSWRPHLPRQGLAGVRLTQAREASLPHVEAAPPAPAHQWLPWVANLRLLSPDAAPQTVVPGEGALAGAQPSPPELMPHEPHRRPTLRQRLRAWMYDIRHR